jgi:uncharacterized membrane protein YgaE (UPF0421/DUF939 family)
VEFLNSLLFFSFSDKLKFSIKVSLSMVLAYMIPLSQGWDQPHTAAITVMLIAMMGSVNESVLKGALRVIGTLIGAVIGMVLIALFPQDRMLYLSVLSIVVTITLYLRRAYNGDNTIFMLSAITMMMVFQSGEVDDVFLYGIDRTYMTVFGITVYTLVGIFLWPVTIQDSTHEDIKALSSLQLKLFLLDEHESREEIIEQLHHYQNRLLRSSADSDTTSLTTVQWHNLLHHYEQVSEYIMLLSDHNSLFNEKDRAEMIQNYEQLPREIIAMLQECSNSWESEEMIAIPDEIEPLYRVERVKKLSHLDRASLISTIQTIKALHQELRELAKKLNAKHSPVPTFFQDDNVHVNERFCWGDIEDIKGAFVTFLIFWAATLAWIFLNPPGGFLIVTLATALSVVTTFSPVRPAILITVFSFSFVFATLMYLFVLPSLHYSWELALFIFMYSFISFYFINEKITVFFLMGLFTLNITNEMNYNVALFLLILTTFYSFLALLQIFYYVPFSTRAEHLFLKLKRRFFKLSTLLLEASTMLSQKRSWWRTALYRYAHKHLLKTAEKMGVWSALIDTAYFDSLNAASLREFNRACEHFGYTVLQLYEYTKTVQHNPLMLQLESKNKNFSLTLHDDVNSAVQEAEYALDTLLKEIDFVDYSKEEIGAFYQTITLRKEVLMSYFTCKYIMKQIDFDSLTQSRF